MAAMAQASSLSPPGAPETPSDPMSSPLAIRGSPPAQVIQYWCATCHGAGPGHPGTDALQAKYHGAKPAVLEDRTDLDPAAVRFFVRHGVTVMPFFRKTEISDADLDAIGAYLARKR